MLGDLTNGTLIAVALGVCVAQMAAALPSVLNGLFQLDLGTSPSQLTWIGAAFLVPVTLLELTTGVLGDLFGRKRLLVGGALLLAAGSLVAVLTPGSGSAQWRVAFVWIGQGLNGVGAACIVPTTLATLAAVTYDARQRGRVIAIYVASLSSGFFLGAVLGGALAEVPWGSDPHASWRWAYVLVGAVALLSAAVSVHGAGNSSAPEGRSLDWPGQITIAVALFALLFAVIQASTIGWGRAEVIAGFVVAAVFLALFVALERGRASPLLRLDLFRNRAFAITAFVAVVGMFPFIGTAYATSIRVSAIQGFSPLQTSIVFVLLQVWTLVLLPVIAYVTPRVNPRWRLGGGLALMAVGDFWASNVPVSHVSIGSIAAPICLVGIGFAFAVSSILAVAVNTVPIPLAGMASATTTMLRDVGFTLAPAVIASVAFTRAASIMRARIAASPVLRRALDRFYGAVGQAPPASRPRLAAAVAAVKSGPLGANAIPATARLPSGHVVPLNPIKGVAFDALGRGFSLGYLVCGCAAAVAAVVVLATLRRAPSHRDQPAQRACRDEGS